MLAYNENLDDYRKALTILLDALNTIPSELLPDLLVFHTDLGKEFGVIDGGYEINNKESNANGIIQKKYSNLKRNQEHLIYLIYVFLIHHK
mgnify:CR=1 FL=1